MKTLKRITAMTLALCMFGTCGDWSPIAKAAGKEEETVATETTIVAESYEEPKNLHTLGMEIRLYMMYMY